MNKRKIPTRDLANGLTVPREGRLKGAENYRIALYQRNRIYEFAARFHLTEEFNSEHAIRDVNTYFFRHFRHAPPDMFVLANAFTGVPGFEVYLPQVYACVMNHPMPEPLRLNTFFILNNGYGTNSPLHGMYRPFQKDTHDDLTKTTLSILADLKNSWLNTSVEGFVQSLVKWESDLINLGWALDQAHYQLTRYFARIIATDTVYSAYMLDSVIGECAVTDIVVAMRNIKLYLVFQSRGYFEAKSMRAFINRNVALEEFLALDFNEEFDIVNLRHNSSVESCIVDHIQNVYKTKGRSWL